MSDCLHCDILEMLESHPKGKEADLAEVAANVTQVLADLILMAPQDEQTMLMADVLANLAGCCFKKVSSRDARVGAGAQISGHGKLPIRRVGDYCLRSAVLA
jgi:hypothetical protein